MAAPTLYSMDTTMPQKKILRYTSASGRTSSGTFIHTNANGATIRPMTVIASPPTIAMAMPVCTPSCTPCSLWEPKN